MRIVLQTSFAVDKKQPLAAVLKRIHDGFAAADLPAPAVEFALSDSPVGGGVSAVERALNRFPELAAYQATLAPYPDMAAIAQISNRAGTPGHGTAPPFSTLLAVAAGVPRSLPFHGFGVRFIAPAFGAADETGAGPMPVKPGITIRDSWWVNGRQRAVEAITIVEAERAGKTLPPLPPAVQAVLAACGKAKTTRQTPLDLAVLPPALRRKADNAPGAAEIRALTQSYKARLDAIVAEAKPPHDLPPNQDAASAVPPGVTAGPRKPALEAAFKPLGYDCRGGTGTFTLRRRTPENLTVQIDLDVGTWGHRVIGFYRVKGLGFTASLPLPVAPRAAALGQYPIGDAAQWQKIVENLAALVAAYDRDFVPQVAAISGPSPAWYRPES